MADLMEKLVDKWIADSESYKMAMNDEKLKERTQTLAKHKYEQLCLCISELRGALAMAKFETRNCNLSDVSNLVCQYIPDNTTAMNCKNCGNPKWHH